jgi:hypothetical protein
VLYGRYKNWLIHHADKKFTTVPAEEEIATHKQAIADIENRSYDVFDPIPPAYRTSYAAHSIYNILNNGRAKTWERATDVYENEKARNDMYESMSKATAAAQRQAEAAMAQAEVAQQRADDAEWEAAQATSAARCAERKAQVDAAEAERRAMAYTNSRHF